MPYMMTTNDTADLQLPLPLLTACADIPVEPYVDN